MSAKKPKFFYGYVVVSAAFIVLLVNGGTMYSFGVFFKPLLDEFGWTRATTSGAFSLFQFLHGLFYIISGRLTDRFGPRIVTTMGGCFLGLGYLLMSQVTSIWQLYLFYGVLVAIGMTGGLIPLTSTVARWFVKRRGMMTGIVVSGIGVGTIIVPTVATWIIHTYGWRTSYLIIGITSLILVLLAAQFLRREPSQMGQMPYGADEVKEESLNPNARGFSFQETLRTGQFWMLFLMYLCFGFCQQSVMVHINPHATDLGFSTAIATRLLAIIGGVSILGKITFGVVGDRIGNKSANIISFVLMAGALSWLLVTKQVWMFYLFATIFGIAYGGLVTLQSPMVADLFGLYSHGIILGIVSFGFSVGGTVGPVLVGHMFDITGSYQLAFLILACVSMISIILIILLRLTSRKAAAVN